MKFIISISTNSGQYVLAKMISEPIKGCWNSSVTSVAVLDCDELDFWYESDYESGDLEFTSWAKWRPIGCPWIKHDYPILR